MKKKNIILFNISFNEYNKKKKIKCIDLFFLKYLLHPMRDDGVCWGGGTLGGVGGSKEGKRKKKKSKKEKNCKSIIHANGRVSNYTHVHMHMHV